jgi:uncharacterized protein (DUF1684 family)
MQKRRATFKRIVPMLAVVIVLSCGGGEEKQDEQLTFEMDEIRWREERGWSMMSTTSWLTIAGLFWLEEGENTFGTGAVNAIRLPEGSAPAEAGVFELREGIIRVIPADGVAITMKGTAIGETQLTSDGAGKPDIIALNDLKMWVLMRGDRYAIRLRDFNAPRLKNFKGLEFFPIKEEYRIRGEYHPFPAPRQVMVPTIIGTEAVMVSPGYITFGLAERHLRLDAFEAGNDPNKLFIVFKDRTSGAETYGACRFLTAEILDDDGVDLNFNRAHNPPCAYTPYATCPLPPRRNELSVRIEAGEKMYGTAH